jgi:Helix-turn-helix domain
MTLDDSIHAQRLRVLREAEQSGQVTATCRRYGMSRSRFYALRKRLQQYGPDGVRPKPQKGRPGRPLQVRVEDERRILALAIAWPTRGPQWVSDELGRDGHRIPATTVWRVLVRHGLNHRSARLVVLEQQSAARGLLTERTVRRGASRHLEADQPADLVSLDLFYVGKLKGVGKVWQITACDVASSYGWARVVTGEVTAAAVVAFLREVVVPRCRQAGWELGRVLTDNGKEFKGAFDAGCQALGIRQTRKGDVALPLGTRHGDLPSRCTRKIYVTPLQSHDLAAAETGVAAEQDDEFGPLAVLAGTLDQPLVLLEVVEGHRWFSHLQQSDGTRHHLDHLPLDSDAQHRVKHRQRVIHRLRALAGQGRLHLLDIFGCHFIEPLVPKPRNQVGPEDRLLAGNPTRLLLVGYRADGHVESATFRDPAPTAAPQPCRIPGPSGAPGSRPHPRR